MPAPESEIRLIEAFSDASVIGLTINHEGMADSEIEFYVSDYRKHLDIPATDALARPAKELVEMVLSSFPELEEKLSNSSR